MDFTDAIGAFPVPEAYTGFDLTDWGQKGAHNDARAWGVVDGWLTAYSDWADQRPRSKRNFLPGIVLIGPPGTGKTYLASVMLSHILGDGRRASGAFVDDGDMASMFKATRYRFDEANEDALDMLMRVTIVVYDDMLRFGGDESQVERFLRTRWRNGKTTIITMNNGVRLGEVLTSFLTPFAWVTFSGNDLRKD